MEPADRAYSSLHPLPPDWIPAVNRHLREGMRPTSASDLGLEPEEDGVPRPLRHPVVESQVMVERELGHRPKPQQPDDLFWRERPHPAGRRVAKVVEPDLHPVAAHSRFRITSTASWAPTRLR